MTNEIINEININNASCNIIILKDNGVISSTNSDIYNHIISYVNDDKYNIRNLDGEFLHKDKFNTSFINKYYETDNYRINDYLGALNIFKDDVVNNLFFTSRFDNDNLCFTNALFSSIYDIDEELFDLSAYKDIDKNNYLKTAECINDTLTVLEFVASLNNAIKKGMFRQYNEFEHNDTKVKGRIDVSRQVVKNQSIQGKVCYTTREYTSKNIINMMILKTYLFLERKNKKLLEKVLLNNKDAKKYIVKLKNLLPNIEEYGISDILSKGNVKITNMVYKEYESLRKVCIGILKSKGVKTYDENDTRISGIVYDIEKYWSKFIYNTIIKKLVSDDREEDDIKIMNSNVNNENDFELILKRTKTLFCASYSNIHEKYDTLDPYKKIEHDKFINDLYESACEIGTEKIFVIYPLSIDEDFDYNTYEELVKKFPMGNIELYKIPFVFLNNDDFREYKKNIVSTTMAIKKIIFKKL